MKFVKRWIKNKSILFALITGVLCTPVICHAKESAPEELSPISALEIADGTYEVEADSSSSMFRIVKAVLHVSGEAMTAELTLGGKGYLHLYMGSAQEAQMAEEDAFIPYRENAEGAYVYTIPVKALDQEFPCAAYSIRKEKWYDRQLILYADSLPQEALTPAQQEIALPDGEYTVEAALFGGSGKAGITSPVHITVKDQKAAAELVWSSPHYDYMLVGGQKYLPRTTEKTSVFEIPLPALDQEIKVTADTVAMSRPHEVTYTLIFYGDTVKPEKNSQRAVFWILAIAAVLLAAAAFWYLHRKGRKGSGMLLLLLVFLLTGCGKKEQAVSSQLIQTGSMELQYASRFTADYYEGGYTLLSITDGERCLVVPKGKEPPQDLAEDIAVLKQPLQNIYLAASAAMDMMCELDCLDAVRFSGQSAENWCIKEAADAMEQGTLLYAGKYNMPDYERIVSEGCSLAVENNMIFHSPEVMEKLESFGIPVLVDHSSYESHPLGRVEWIKFYGALMGKEEKAQEAFEEVCQKAEKAWQDAEAEKTENAEKTAAFFYLTANNMVNTRRGSDYIAKMIELAGGTYIFDDLGGKEGGRSSVTIQMEEFYHTAKDADYLIYNGTVNGEIKTIGELLQKEALFADFKAVQNGKVWCTTKDMYQQTMSIGSMIEDIHAMLYEKSGKPMTCMYPLENDLGLKKTADRQSNGG